MRRMIPILLLAALAACGAPARLAPSAPPLPADATLATIPVGTPPTFLAISPDGSRVFAASASQLVVVRTDTNAVAGTATIPPYTNAVAVTPDGRRVLSIGVRGASVTVVDAATAQVLKPLPLILGINPGGFGRMAATPDGASVWVTNQPKEYVAIAPLSGGTAVESLLDMRPTDVTFTPDGRSVYLTGCRDFCSTGTIEQLDVASRNVVRRLTTGPSPYRFALSPDGTRGYTTNLAAPSLSILDLGSGSVVATVPVGVEPTGLAVSPDGKRVYVASQTAGTLAVVDAQAGTVLRTHQMPSQPREVVVSPDGRRVYVSVRRAVLVLDGGAL
ncbi:MAG: beta-propeller fold lactonase family protein [bacterium]|nr:beta-propeller fold lactonase family protein [bacterium]